MNKFLAWLDKYDLVKMLQSWLIVLFLGLVLAAGVYQICQDIWDLIRKYIYGR